jgi:hypothetical protein
MYKLYEFFGCLLSSKASRVTASSLRRYPRFRQLLGK